MFMISGSGIFIIFPGKLNTSFFPLTIILYEGILRGIDRIHFETLLFIREYILNSPLCRYTLKPKWWQIINFRLRLYLTCKEERCVASVSYLYGYSVWQKTAGVQRFQGCGTRRVIKMFLHEASKSTLVT